MKPDVMAARMAVLTRALPRRILLVDDDDLQQDLMTERLSAAGFELTRAMNGEEALAVLATQWFPVVITDWQMPVMDGIALTETLRRKGVEDTYIIMLSMRDASIDYERGYLAGVDDYLTKNVSDADLFARIYAAYNTLGLRRSLKEAQAALDDTVSIDAASGAFATRELYSKLHAEIHRAQRYGRRLAALMINVVLADDHAPPPDEILKDIVRTIDSTVRAHVDWIGRAVADTGAMFALVLPEAGIVETPIVKERLLRALRLYAENEGVRLEFRVGAVALEHSQADSTQTRAPVDATEMLDVAAHCLNCPGRTSPEQLRAVQRSVAGHVAIVCRHGYVVDSVCTLKNGDAERSDTQ